MRLTKIVSIFCVLFLVFFSWSLHCQDTTLISSGAVWKYYDYDSSPGASWMTAGFNDSGWDSGNAKLGYSDGAVTVIEPSSSASTKYITAYFRKSFNYTDDGSVHTLNLEILRDDGAIVYINGSEVARSNMPSGSVSHSTLASSTVSGSDEDAFFPFELSTNALVDGSNVIAVEIHQRSTSSSDLGFDLKLTVSGGSPVGQVSNIRFGSTGGPLNGLTVTWQNAYGADRIKWGYTPSFEQGEFATARRSDYSDYLYDYTFPTVQANATIYYSIYDDSAGAWGSSRTFNTAPPASSTQFTFTAGGDSRTYVNDWKSVADVWDNTAFVLFLGDIVNNGSTSSQWEDWYSYGDNFVPYNLIYHSKGNHDNGGIYENQYALPGNGLYYAFEYGNAVFICLDSENPGSSTQTNWLESTLSDYQNKTWKFIFFHKPFYTAGSHESDMWSYWDTWWQLFDDYGVNMIFGGHDHNYQRSLPINRNVSTSQPVAEYGSGPGEGRCNIVSGGAGAPIYSASDRWWTAAKAASLNFCIIEVNGSSLTLTVKDENLAVIDQVVMNAGGGATTPPTAAFTAAPTSGSAPLNVSFTDTSGNSPTSWSWTFEGGSPAGSTAQNPAVTYDTAGTYDVTLTATNSAGDDTEIKTDFITVTEALPTVGHTTVFSSTTTTANRRTMPFTMPEDGAISSVTMYHTGGGGNMILGVYDGEGSPANRIGVTPSTPVNGGTGWQTINLTSSAFVPGGSTVWLAWVYESNPGIWYESGSPGRMDAGVAWSGGMPDPFGSSTQADYIYSIYASYTPGGGPAQYTLTTNTVGQGSIALNPTGGTYNDGTVVTLTANPASGWQFDGWSGALSGSTNPDTITMNSDKSVTATFTETGATQTVGNTVTYGSSTTTANRRSMPFTMPEDGTISSVTMYHTGGGGSMILGVYDGEGSPANRIGVTPTTPVNGSTGWQTINLTSSAFVPGGSTVWLAWVYESNPGISYESGAPGRVDAGEVWSGGMPDPFGSSTQADYIYSIYATYTPGGGAVEPPVANFNGSPTTLDEGQSVSFTDTSTNNPTSWSWTFPGGSPSNSTAKNPVVTYNTAGTYSVTLTAANSAGSDPETKSNYITVEVPTIVYCTSSANDQGYEWIAGVQAGSIDNASGATGYSDFTAQSANLTKGASVSITLTPGFASSSYSEYWKIWIDLNHDGDFDDAGEEVYSGSGSSPISGNFTVPTSASIGNTRMRVSMQYNAYPSYCGTFSYGEVEDYTVNIQ
jgi:PKD repeat protein